jgi:putative NADH-flavin reductase
MNILVLGATGPLGHQLVARALAEGHSVTALVRTPGRLDPQPNLTEVVGDVLEPATLTAAVEGHDAVISALGQARPSPRGRELYPAVPHVIQAMRTAGVGRLIWISSHGVGDSRGRSGVIFERLIVPLALRAEFADKERQEALVAASDLDWTIVRPARLTDGPATGRVRAKSRLRLTVRDHASRADVAGFVLRELGTGEHLGTAPTIVGRADRRPDRRSDRRPQVASTSP